MVRRVSALRVAAVTELSLDALKSLTYRLCATRTGGFDPKPTVEDPIRSSDTGQFASRYSKGDRR